MFQGESAAALLQREAGLMTREAFHKAFHFAPAYAKRLKETAVLKGHEGCVNRLSWNEDGSMLISGSDDKQLIMWHYPDVERKPLAISTEHRANVFGCQILPCTSNSRVVSGAMDNTVQLHDIVRPAGRHPSYRSPSAGGSASAGQWSSPGAGGGRRHQRASDDSQVMRVLANTTIYHCHTGRVKDVKVEPGCPHMFWSASEDGFVRQFDTRLGGQGSFESPNALVHLAERGASVEVKGLDINRRDPHLIALACGDAWIRVYDRRKLSPGSPGHRGSFHTAAPPLFKLAPPHMPLMGGSHVRRAHSTCVSFSNAGDRLVATFHGDHAYCFDVSAAANAGATTMYASPSALAACRTAASPAAAGTSGGDGPVVPPAAADFASPSGRGGSFTSLSSPSSPPLPAKAEAARIRGNQAMFESGERGWTQAVYHFSCALSYAPDSALLRSNRAAALLRRGWAGDAAFALADAEQAIALCPTMQRALLQRVQALKALRQYRTALHALQALTEALPSSGGSGSSSGGASTSSGGCSQEVRELKDELCKLVQERQAQFEVRAAQRLRRRQMRQDALRSLVGGGSGGRAASQQQQRQAQNEEAQGPPPPGGGAAAADAGSNQTGAAAAEPLSPLQPAMSHLLDLSGQPGQVTAAASASAAHGTPNSRPPPPPCQQSIDGVERAGAEAEPAAGAPVGAQRVGAIIEDGDDEEEDEYEGEEDDEYRDEEGEEQCESEASSSDPDYDDDDDDADADDEQQDARSWSEEDDRDDEPLLVGSRQQLLQSSGRRTRGGASASGRSTGGGSNDEDGGNVASGGIRSLWRHTESGRRLRCRYIGHSNTATDIKESVFVGQGDQLVACGSDDGRVFIYDSASGLLVKVLQADEDVANCVQCHPTEAVLATSGIESVVRLWSPQEGDPEARASRSAALSSRGPRQSGSEDDEAAAAAAAAMDAVVENQDRSRRGPQYLRLNMGAFAEHPQLLQMIMGQLYRGTTGGHQLVDDYDDNYGGGGEFDMDMTGLQQPGDDDDDEGGHGSPPPCRVN